jgi:hypothetical protein
MTLNHSITLSKKEAALRYKMTMTDFLTRAIILSTSDQKKTGLFLSQPS